MAADHPYGRTRDFMARLTGLGRPVLYAMGFATVVSTTVAAGTTLWALYKTETAGEQVRRYVVYVDAQMNPVRTAQIDSEWSPSKGAYVDFAQTWIRNLRSRPLDEQTLILQRKKVIWTTDGRVYGALQESMKAADAELQHSALDVDTIAANLIDGGDGDRAVVLVRWTEHERSAPGVHPVPYTATLTITYKAPSAQAEFDRNPLGFFVTDFQSTQTTEEGRRPPPGKEAR